MIFVEVKDIDEWMLHFKIRPITAKCSHCSRTLQTNRPFVENGYVGIAVEICRCGKNENMADVRVTNAEWSKRKWTDLMKPFLTPQDLDSEG